MRRFGTLWRKALLVLLCVVGACSSTEEMCKSIQQGVMKTVNVRHGSLSSGSKPRVALIYSGQVCRERVLPVKYQPAIWESNLNGKSVFIADTLGTHPIYTCRLLTHTLFPLGLAPARHG